MAINALTNCSNFEKTINACKEALKKPAWRPISLDEMQELHEEFGVRANVIFAIEDMLKEKNSCS
jgi:hypothetical protein